MILQPGATFGNLTVKSLKAANMRYVVLCSCKCGNERYIPSAKLLKGQKTCCHKCPLSRKTTLTHGHSRGGKGGRTPEYIFWCDMKQRCHVKTHESFQRYGGSGISVCKRWMKFENFLADMGPKPSPKHSIERIKNSIGYRPSNCRWATPKEQTRNRSNTVMLRHEGAMKLLAEWAEIFKLPYGAVLDRTRRGWPSQRALTEPLRKRSAR